MNYSSDNLNTHVALNKGIQAAHFGALIGWNEDTYTGGKYHDGTSGWAASYPDEKLIILGVEEAPDIFIQLSRKLFRRHYASTDTRVITIPMYLGSGNRTCKFTYSPK